MLGKLDLKTYDIKFPAKVIFTPQTYLWLDEFVDCPYFVDKKKIIVTMEKMALQLMLFAGDITKYGLARAMSKNGRKKGMNNTYCTVPFRGFQMTHRDNRLCCSAGSSMKTLPSEFWYSEYIKDVRSKMTNGQEVKDCNKCYNQEKNKQWSLATNL